MSAYAEITGSMKPSDRGTRWPQGAAVPPGWIYMGYKLRNAAKLPRINLYLEAEKFADFWSAKTGKGAKKLDWQACWRNWCRNAYGAQPEAEPEPIVPNDGISVLRVQAALKLGFKPPLFDIQDVRVALRLGRITAEQARRLGLKS
jgi:hypothetical protein